MSIKDYLSEFKILKTFKETGQKRVFLAEHPTKGRLILKIGKVRSKTDLNRAEREVNIQKKLDSDYYPKVIDFRSYDDNNFVIIEEYIDALPLSECRDRFVEPLSILILLKKLVEALDLLWRDKKVHRDIKPDNILIKEDNSPVIIDLGIVLSLKDTSLTHPFARSGPGTPRYAAPEQFKHRRTNIDHRTDQFILGIVIMELILEGVHPFDPAIVKAGESIENNILNDRWYRQRLEDADMSILRPLLSNLLHPEPFGRYRNADSLLSEINVYLKAVKK